MFISVPEWISIIKYEESTGQQVGVEIPGGVVCGI